MRVLGQEIGGTGPASAVGSVAAAAADLREFGTAATPPADVADLSRMIGDIPGTDLGGLVARLSSDLATAERALGELVEDLDAQASPSEPAASGPGSSTPGAARPGIMSPGTVGPVTNMESTVEPRSPWVPAPVSSPIPVNHFSTTLPQADRRSSGRPSDVKYMITGQVSGLTDNTPERHPETRSHAPFGIPK